MLEALNAPAAAILPCQSVAVPTADHERFVGQPVVLFGLNIEKKVMQRYGKLSRTLGIKVSQSYCSKVTHVLVNMDDPNIRTLPNFYCAVLQGQSVVDCKC